MGEGGASGAVVTTNWGARPELFSRESKPSQADSVDSSPRLTGPPLAGTPDVTFHDTQTPEG